MTGPLFALVLTTYLTTGEVQESVIDIFPTYTECMKIAAQQKIEGSCYPVEKIIHQGEEKPAGY
ncbi:DUF1482 family protein [Erwinia sp. HR93]|uniref:DUF1482 family protein n=1 Tax=Erwinia sp. HR93 TaxID=3094840 RepID=UPI002ADEC6AF|nr:DUF1482 family protein [Erwinia sp. HR93]MEA1064709.1 DUF1482 family protein [Erwinia sp. HR93]